MPCLLQNTQLKHKLIDNFHSNEQDCHDPYLRIRAQRARYGILCRDGLPKVVLVNGAQIGRIYIDNKSLEMRLDGSEFFDFIGMFWRPSEPLVDMEGDVAHVYALCIRRVDDRSNVYERLGVAQIEKHESDKVAEFDENIILG
jgi:hypothetical protein